jgi:hypothetical protein
VFRSTTIVLYVTDLTDRCVEKSSRPRDYSKFDGPVMVPAGV